MSVSSIDIKSLNIDVEDLRKLMEGGDEKLEVYVEELLEGKSPDQAEEILEAIREELSEAVGDLEHMLEGAEEDEEWAEDVDDETMEAKAEAEQDELEDLIDFIEDDVLDNKTGALLDVEQEYHRLNYNTDEDLLVATSDLEDGELLTVNATGGQAQIFENKDEEYDGSDINGDGIVNYTDFELFESKQKEGLFEDYQDVFLDLASGDKVVDVQYTSEEATFTIQNTETGKKTQFKVSGINNGVHIYLDSEDDGFISKNMMNSWDDEFQGKMYIGDDALSVYEHNNEVQDADKLSYIKGYDETIAEVASVAGQFGITNEKVISKSEEYLSDLYGYVNDFSGDQIEEIWAQIIQDMNGMEQQQKSDILLVISMTLAMEGGQQMSQMLLAGAGNNIGKIENVLMADGTYDQNEAMLVMFLETNLGAVGSYGGAEVFWDYNNSKMTGVFGSDSLGNVLVNADEFGTTEEMQKALALYESTIAKIGWATNNGQATEYTKLLETSLEEETTGKSELMSSDNFDNLASAKYKYHPKGGDHVFDGISAGEFQTGVTLAITEMMKVENPDGTEDRGSLRAYGDALILHLGSLEEDAGDIAAGVIYALSKTSASPSGNMLDLLLKAHPDLEGELRRFMQGEIANETAPIEDAIDYLDEH